VEQSTAEITISERHGPIFRAIVTASVFQLFPGCRAPNVPIAHLHNKTRQRVKIWLEGMRDVRRAHKAAPKLSERPEKPEHEAVFVSNIMNGFVLATAVADKMKRLVRQLFMGKQVQ
jgi:hypothetical protein